MRTLINLTIVTLFCIACTAIGYYCWPLLVGYAIYRIAKRIYMQHLVKRTLRTAPFVRPLAKAQARLTFVK